LSGGAELEKLVRGARAGDESAWGAIVDRSQALVWATTRAHRLPRASAADVAQTTGLQLVENLDRIKDPGIVARTRRSPELAWINSVKEDE
jgi:DNA-directed RNA polymerase specialized sigma24 family protein